MNKQYETVVDKHYKSAEERAEEIRHALEKLSRGEPPLLVRAPRTDAVLQAYREAVRAELED